MTMSYAGNLDVEDQTRVFFPLGDPWLDARIPSEMNLQGCHSGDLNRYQNVCSRLFGTVRLSFVCPAFAQGEESLRLKKLLSQLVV